MAAVEGHDLPRNKLLIWLLGDKCDTTEHKAARYSLQSKHDPIFYRSLVKRVKMLNKLLDEMVLDEDDFTWIQRQKILGLLTSFHGLAEVFIDKDVANPAEDMELMRTVSSDIADLIRNNGPSMWNELGHQQVQED